VVCINSWTKSNVELCHSGIEGTDQFKSYLQKRKPPRPVKSLQGLNKLRRADVQIEEVLDSKKDTSGKGNSRSKGKVEVTPKLNLKSTKKTKKYKK
jgi:hypothetical protein